MPKQTSRAASAINKINGKRYSYQLIADWVQENHGIFVHRSHLFRIGTGERAATPELEKAVIQAAKVLK